MEGYTYGSRQEIGSPYCQIVYADFNRKSYFPIGFRGGSRIEPSRAERSNPVRSSRYERTLLNRLTRSSFQSRSAIREEICIYIYIHIVYTRSSKKHEENQLFEASKRGRRSDMPIDFHINVTFTKSLAVNRSRFVLLLYFPFSPFSFSIEN